MLFLQFFSSFKSTFVNYVIRNQIVLIDSQYSEYNMHLVNIKYTSTSKKV